MEQREDRQIRTTREFDAPVELMWEVWTNPEHIVQWWGPNNFTTTIHTMDVTEGGEWKLTMHGPDGTNYPNRSIYKELVPLKKIVFEHFNPHFITTVLFEARGERTYVDWSMEFDTAELRDIVVKAHGAIEGMRQNVEKLGVYLASR